MKKFLIIRFSSIGDIVLTTPVIRCLKRQYPGAEVHYLTKQQFLPVIAENPYIDKIFTIKEKISEVIPALKLEKYDQIIDLHKNLRSLGILINLHRPFSTFTKLSFRKFLICTFRIDILPDIHIVDRYLGAVKKFGIKNDGHGLDYFIPAKDEVAMDTPCIALVIGGKHATKQLPPEKLANICKDIAQPIIILGGPEDRDTADFIITTLQNDNIEPGNSQPGIINACGRYNLNQSASILRQAEKVITHDTGLMHIAAAFRKEILSVWGNTIPGFGMYPYFPEGFSNTSFIAEVKGLSCRPCSRIGYKKCPKGHFKCMKNIDEKSIISWAG